MASVLGSSCWGCIRASALLMLMLLLLPAANASYGDAHPSFTSCLSSCRASGCVNDDCINGCGIPPDFSNPSKVPTDNEISAVDSRPINGSWVLQLFKWDCLSECRYRCMHTWRNPISQGQPVKFYGKWPFRRFLGMQEPAAVAFSFLNFLATLYGLLSFIHLVFFQLPRKKGGDRGPLFEYAGLYVVYGLVSMNSWLWSAIFHSRDTPLTQAWDYSSAIALLASALILAIIRAAGLRLEAARVMVSAPILAFAATHILYLNFYTFDYGLNIIVCTIMGISQLLLWLIWGLVTRHPAFLQLLFATLGTTLAMLLELYDFPPIGDVFDAHSLWHASTIPLTLLWWSFLQADARWRTNILASTVAGVKKTD